MSDIAKRAGVSRPTVSIVLNERHTEVGIAEATRARVLQAAQELGYRRNELARAVKTGRSRTLGFLAGAAHLEYSARFFSGVLDEAEDAGYSVHRLRLQAAREDEASFAANARALVRCVENRLSGVVVHDPDDELDFEAMKAEFETHVLPTVFLDNRSGRKWGLQVVADEAEGAAQAVRHLVELGHQRIAFVGGIEGHGTSIPRFAGYRRAMEAAGLTSHLRGEWTNWQERTIDTAIGALISEKQPFTGILCGSDALGLYCVRQLRRSGLRVPDDVSVIGFGNLARLEFADPPLSTVAVPYEEMGRLAVRSLIERIEGRETVKTPRATTSKNAKIVQTVRANAIEVRRFKLHTLPTRLVLRESTREAA